MSWRTIASTSRHTFKRLNAIFRSHSTTFPSPHHSRAFLHAPFTTTTLHSAQPTNALIDPKVHATHNDAFVDDEDTTNEFLSRFVWIMRKKVQEAYPECDKATVDGMLVAIVERVTSEMEKGGGVQTASSGSGDFSEDLWGTVWEVSNLVLQDMDKERKKEKMKGFLQCEEVKEMCRFAGEVGIRGDLLRELRFKWAREKMEEREFYEGLERIKKEAQNEEKERDVGEEGKKEKVDVGLPKRKGKIRYKIYGLDLSDPKWAQVADRIHEAEEVFWPQEPKAITGKAKIVRSKILSLKEDDDGLQSLLDEWMELVQPSRVEWIDLLDNLKEQNRSLYLKVAEMLLTEDSFQTNVSDYSRLIDIYAKEDCFDDVERLVKKMSENGIQIDASTASVLVHMYCKGGNLARANEAFEILTGLGFRPDFQVYNSMIMAFVNNGQPNLADKLTGTPDPDAEVVVLSPKSLMATNRFICEICKKGFQRDQNLQLHRRGHNLPWKLKQRTNKDQVRKKVYVCPEKSCVHHDPSRALGDLTGIKKHYSRKHGEKKWKCDKCSKKYAVQSDWKAHSKICGTREYKCDCGTLFSRKDSFITHRAFCDALAEESVRLTTVPAALSNLRKDHHLTNAQASRIPQIFSGFHSDQLGGSGTLEPLVNYADADHHHHNHNHQQQQQQKLRLPLWLDHQANPQVFHHPLINFPTKTSAFTSSGPNPVLDGVQTMDMFGPQFVNYRCPEASFGGANLSVLPPHGLKQEQEENKGDLSHSAGSNLYLSSNQNPPHYMSATTLWQKTVQMGSMRVNDNTFRSIGSNRNSNHNNAVNNVVVEVQKLDELVSVEGCTNLGGGGGYLLNDDSNNSFVVVNGTKGLEHMVMPVDEETPASIMGKQLHSISSHNKIQLGLTRDFLGVGDNNIESIRRPFFQQDLVEFNAMGSASAMNLQSQYGGHYV